MAMLTNPTNRRTEARRVTLRGIQLYFSYETLIAVSGFAGGEYKRMRLDNCWGPTTGRHINDMGLRDWPIVDDDELDATLDRMLLTAASSITTDMLDGSYHKPANNYGSSAHAH